MNINIFFFFLAAHCFWEDKLSSNTLLTDNGEYKIAVGKYTRDITIKDNSFTQIINVWNLFIFFYKT